MTCYLSKDKVLPMVHQWPIFAHFLNSIFLAIGPINGNQRTSWLTIGSYLMVSLVLAWLTWFGFVSFVFVLDICFSHKKFGKICELLAHLAYDHTMLVKKAKSSHKPTFFLEITALFLSSLLLHLGQTFREKHRFFQFEISLSQVSKHSETYILPLEKEFKTSKDTIIGTVGI